MPNTRGAMREGHEGRPPEETLGRDARSEGLNQRELGDELLVTKGNVSHLVDRL